MGKVDGSGVVVELENVLMLFPGIIDEDSSPGKPLCPSKSRHEFHEVCWSRPTDKVKLRTVDSDAKMRCPTYLFVPITVIELGKSSHKLIIILVHKGAKLINSHVHGIVFDEFIFLAHER